MEYRHIFQLSAPKMSSLPILREVQFGACLLCATIDRSFTFRQLHFLKMPQNSLLESTSAVRDGNGSIKVTRVIHWPFDLWPFDLWPHVTHYWQLSIYNKKNYHTIKYRIKTNQAKLLPNTTIDQDCPLQKHGLISAWTDLMQVFLKT